jgi:uncharacterized protein (TIGR04222 family)
MDPFDWTGGRFLLFYLALATLVVMGAWVWTRFVGAPPRAKLTDLTSDPYRIACLRNGYREAIRVAVFNLVDRGLLGFDGTRLRTLNSEAPDFLQRPLDRAIVAACRSTTKAPRDLLHDDRVRLEARKYAKELSDKGLNASEDESLARRRFLYASLGLLLGVAAVKIALALSRGHGNIVGLIGMAVAASVLLSVVALNPINRAGRSLLRDLQTLTKRLKGRVKELKSGGGTNEALLAVSMYGLAILPLASFPLLEGLYIPKRSSGGDGASSSCGSGSSCSSSCGGGGGCGGCGS